MIFELGGIPEREPEKLKAEDDRLGKSSFAFAFCMDRQKEERERGVIIACTTEEFSTEKKHFTNIDAPGHCDFIKNMITGTSQALIMVPCDENFTIAIAKRNHKAGEIQGQTRQPSRLINLLGVKQIAIGCNKMDCDTAGYKITRYVDVSNEMKSMSVKIEEPQEGCKETSNNEQNLQAEYDQLVEDVRELIRMGPDNKEAVKALAHKRGECEDAVEEMQYYVDTMRRNFYRKLDEMGFKPS